MDMGYQYYVAYGSNLNKQQMAIRCPDATVVGTGEIKDYELVFRGSHRNRAVATIEPKEGSTVPVAVWNISRYDEVGLDYYEGFPVLYDKLDFQVEMTDGSIITAMAYVMNPGRDFGKPSERYLATIFEGYNDFGISSEGLFAAVERA